MHLLNIQEDKIKSFSEYLISKVNDLVKKGTSAQFSEKLVIHALCDDPKLDLENHALKDTYTNIQTRKSEELTQSDLGMIISDFLYEMLIPGNSSYSKLLDLRSHIRLPSELIWLIISLSVSSKTKTIFCPYLHSIQIALACSSLFEKVRNTVPEQSRLTSTLSKGLSNLEITKHTDIKNELKQTDIKERESILCWLPLQKQFSENPFKIAGEIFSPDTATLRDLNEMVSARPQRMVVLVGQGFLTSSNTAECQLKSFIKSNQLLDSVILLPERIIPGHRWKSALLVLDNNPKKEVRLLDASTQFHVYKKSKSKVPLLTKWKEILQELEKDDSKFLIKNSFQNLDLDFNPRRYLEIKKYPEEDREQYNDLEQIADIFRGQPVKNSKNESVNDSVTCFEASLKDIGEDHILRRPTKEIMTNGLITEKRKQLILRPYDILLSYKGIIGQIALVPDTGEEIWIPNQSFQIIRAKDNYDSIVLFYQLLSAKVQNSLKSRVTGSSTWQIKLEDLKKLPIPILPQEAINTIKEYHSKFLKYRNGILRLENKIQNQFAELKECINKYQMYFWNIEQGSDPDNWWF